MGTICTEGASYTSTSTGTPTTAFAYPDFSCPNGKFISKFKNGVPVCDNPPTGSTTTIVQNTSSPLSALTKWLLDRDCAPSFPNCSLCSQITSGTCPANPGGLTCSSPGQKCVTPKGCRRYDCN